jgi:release factor glutamine methyltransferase
MISVLEVIKRTADFFAGKGIESPRLNAELLVGHALGLKRMQLYLQFERLLTEPELESIRPLVRRRGAREPVQYILGETDFGGLKLKVDKRALIPRPETERLVELIVQKCMPPPSSVLDLGTGSGAIALALAAAWPSGQVTGLDHSLDALALAEENAVATGLKDRTVWLQSNWFSAVPVGAKFELIVSNPPYLAGSETAGAMAEVKDFEPVSALTAAENGLADLRIIIGEARNFLQPGGWVALETGPEQHATLKTLSAAAGWAEFESIADLTGRDRFVFLR